MTLKKWLHFSLLSVAKDKPSNALAFRARRVLGKSMWLVQYWCSPLKIVRAGFVIETSFNMVLRGGRWSRYRGSCDGPQEQVDGLKVDVESARVASFGSRVSCDSILGQANACRVDGDGARVFSSGDAVVVGGASGFLPAKMVSIMTVLF